MRCPGRNMNFCTLNCDRLVMWKWAGTLCHSFSFTSTRASAAAAKVAKYSTAYMAKPPNVLVLTRQTEVFENDSLFVSAKEALTACLDKERYVVYPLGAKDLFKAPWRENCSLLVVPAGTEPDVCSPAVLGEVKSYLQEGGALLSMHPVLNTALGCKFPQTLSRHTIVAVKALNGVGRKEEAVETGAMCVARTVLEGQGSTSDLPTVNLSLPKSLVNVLATMRGYEPKASDQAAQEEQAEREEMEEEEGGRDREMLPCVLHVSYEGSGGQAILSHIDMLSVASKDISVSEMVLLKKDAEEVANLLSTTLKGVGLSCSDFENSDPTPSYLVCSDKLRLKFESALNSVKTDSDTVKGSEVDVELVMTDMTSEGTPVDPLPEPGADRIVLLTNPSHLQLQSIGFDTSQYMKCLQTAFLGRTLIYTPIIGSTQTMLTGNMPFCSTLKTDLGVVCAAGQQTKGKGRRGNVWLSPKGSMMFSTVLTVQPWSRLFKRMSLLQHVVALSVVSAVRTIPGYEAVPVSIKWPNDIYYQDKVKLGGILISCFSTSGSVALTAVIGCGVNVSNKHPTMSVNDCIALHNSESGSSLRPLTVEQLLAYTLNRLEMYLGVYEGSGMQAFQEEYYHYWLHSNATVGLASRGNEQVTILGINEYGYLLVQTQSGEQLTLQPDGNSFDIMKNLIVMK